MMTRSSTIINRSRHGWWASSESAPGGVSVGERGMRREAGGSTFYLVMINNATQ